MIIAKMLGGLGNQMFCYAFARSLQLENNEELFLDCGVYNRYKVRDYSLNMLNIPDTIKNSSEVKRRVVSNGYLNLSQKLYHVFFKIKKVSLRTDKIGESVFQLLGEKGLYYNLDRYYYPIVESKKEFKYTYGYFQSEKYFRGHKELIKKELKVRIQPTNKEKELLEDIKSNDAVGISIRWGKDYRNSPLNICNKEYYYKAMDIIAEKIEEPTFYIFSDCIEDVVKDFDFKYPVRYIEGFKDYESLRLLYTCKHFIIANSSFSWWGAYLSENNQKIVIAPSKWYKDSTKRPDIYLDDMVLIDV
ncbi:alpha-1,2-fucosyltransferase [Bacillus songklensis]|uniref:Alpha-1,2-fucosyltransferase n=1 Tax=Bacillus songklensis TaxID=1069116 RepID=A0ABV8B2Y9_9BACI